ncbi:hypothetical protein KJQ97_00820 [Campylobacter sp. 2018MI01]|uniref:hypothetical protein n=1 Tax=Campylobacter sp. 2018MI01 TaxID=2836735 RepID=UPI001BD9FC67|nr:hypothetical protein [Campylobacter sp. 2018MI01]MBT0877969.1 hypothetical protein [Campylobacter sp. 2018MI01]
MKKILIIIMSLVYSQGLQINLSDEELIKQLPQNIQDNAKKNYIDKGMKVPLIENYRKYGKANQSIKDYHETIINNLQAVSTPLSESTIKKYFNTTKGYTPFTSDYIDKEMERHKLLSKASEEYFKYVDEVAPTGERILSEDEWIEKRAYKLENLGSKLQSYYAMLNAVDTKQSYEKNAKELGLELTKESFINTMLSSHFNEYELSKNNDNETIVKDKALGLSANVGDIESFNYYTLKAFILNYLASILGLIIGIILCVKYKHKALVYISPFVLLALGLVIDYFVIGIKLLKYV